MCKTLQLIRIEHKITYCFKNHLILCLCVAGHGKMPPYCTQYSDTASLCVLTHKTTRTTRTKLGSFVETLFLKHAVHCLRGIPSAEHSVMRLVRTRLMSK